MSSAVFPCAQELDLLKAAYAIENESTGAWRRWRQRNPLESMHYLSRRLLPLLSRKLKPETLPREDFLLLRALYRYHWTRNQLLTRTASAILGDLQGAGVETLVLKGLALAHLVYRDVGARPMNDFDVLIHPQQREQAVKVLSQQGWTPSQVLPYLSAMHGCEFQNAQGQRFDLHWYATAESRWSGADDDFWADSVPLSLGQIETRALSPTHMLLHILIHGVKVTEADPSFWVSDACTLLHFCPQFDWRRFLDSARERRVVLSALLGLEYLRQTMGCEVPDWVSEELAATRVSLSDRLYHATKVRCALGWLGLARPYLDYLRTDRPGWGFNVLGFCDFLRRRWQLQSVFQMPGYILRGVWRRLQRAVTAR